MRTTVDLPEDLHAMTMSIARDTRSSFSATVARLLRSAIGGSGHARVVTSEQTGLVTIALGRLVTTEDVRALDDQ